jgi:hypothetical protein
MISQQLLLVFLGFVSAALLAQNDQQSQKHDLEQLLSAAVPFAEQMLAKHGEFFPYGSSMNSNGKISAVAGYTGNEHPKSAEVIDLLRAGFRRDAEAGKIRACAVVYDIRTVPPGETEKTDAIAVELDHRGGMSIVVVYPYSIAPDKKVTRGESYAVKGEGKIFVAGSPRP